MMMIKWIISWNFSIQSMTKIFWMLTSIFSNLDWWSLLLKTFIHSLLCCFINMEEQILKSKIACHNFLCLSQPRPLWNWLMETRDMPKELGLFYDTFLTVQLYIQWDQFIIFQVTLPKISHQVPSSFIFVFKRLHLNLLNIVNSLTLRVVLGYHHTRLKTILAIFNSKLPRSTLIETIIFLS